MVLGVCGEYIVTSTNNTDDIIDDIREQELTLCHGLVSTNPFVIKKIGIKAYQQCKIKINERTFVIEANDTLEFGYDVFDITSIVAQTDGVKLVIRYLC